MELMGGFEPATCVLRVLDCIFYPVFSNTANFAKSYKIRLSGQDNFFTFPPNTLISAQSVTKCDQKQGQLICTLE